MPIRWRLTLFNALVMGAILALVGISVFFLVRNALLSGVEHAVQDRAAGVARTVESGQAIGADDVERLTLEGVFVVVRDGEGRVLARTVETATAGDSFWRRAVRDGTPVDGRVEGTSGERFYVYASPVDPPDPGSPYLSPYFFRAKALAASSEDGGASSVLGRAAKIPFPIEARVVEVGKSYESAGETVSTFAALLAAAIFTALLVSVGGAYLLARAALSPVEQVVTSGGRPSVSHVTAGGPVRASFDRDLVAQAAQVLLENAIKYTPEDGEIRVRAGARDGVVSLEVSDTGVGIPEEHLPHLVERFYRVDGARTSKGAGLGLSIAQQIAEAHGGTLRIRSKVGEGSTFALELPREGPPPA